jgi:hypothetical protein
VGVFEALICVNVCNISIVCLWVVEFLLFIFTSWGCQIRYCPSEKSSGYVTQTKWIILELKPFTKVTTCDEYGVCACFRFCFRAKKSLFIFDCSTLGGCFLKICLFRFWNFYLFDWMIQCFDRSIVAFQGVCLYFTSFNLQSGAHVQSSIILLCLKGLHSVPLMFMFESFNLYFTCVRR